MKKTALALMIACVALFPVFALADSTLRVQGSATINVEPDTATLYAGYAGEQSDSSLAQQDAADAIEKVVEAIKEKGIEEEDIVTSYINTYPVFNYTDMGEQTLRGYRVEHMLAITVRNIDDVGEVLDAALSAGANDASNVTYTASHEAEVYGTALGLAIENATAKADAMAVAAGLWLGSIEEINEVSGGVSLRYGAKAEYDMAGGASLGSTLRTGNVEVTATVELVFEVR